MLPDDFFQAGPPNPRLSNTDGNGAASFASGCRDTHVHGKNPLLSHGLLMRDASESARAYVELDESGGALSASDPPEFEQLYQLYFGFTWRVLGHLGVKSSALDDAVQEVWLVVHRRLPSFEARSALKTWLFGV